MDCVRNDVVDMDRMVHLLGIVAPTKFHVWHKDHWARARNFKLDKTAWAVFLKVRVLEDPVGFDRASTNPMLRRRPTWCGIDGQRLADRSIKLERPESPPRRSLRITTPTAKWAAELRRREERVEERSREEYERTRKYVVVGGPGSSVGDI